MTLLSTLFGVKIQQNNAIELLNPIDFKVHIKSKKVQLIDVRTPLEYNSGHIKDAKNIDLYSDDFNTEFDKLDKSKPVYVYCRSGVRSNQAANKLIAMGFIKVYDLKGGYLKWVN